MALRERKLWKDIKHVNRGLRWYRIESPVTPGFPDVIGIDKNDATVYFIELKAWKSTTMLPRHGALSTIQRNWHTDARKMGINNFVIGIDGNDHVYIGQSDGFNGVEFTRIMKLHNLLRHLRKEI